ncbi:MAG: AbrB/MazE/SpoVT family DNA-binding domain-containing protein [Alphaproteobacteria bacterium]|nr:AbrB/MazE/SpoVT family DNA-binding domain-containing protein [Alphaproteobacteria bacterium]MBV9373336.1 AbrB/MazE/SpoVT family DNA-binding domain-containing protein [Alphaproteobacteria bacterium]MBV9902554.1 AbrB/MazE/SpoVT family DNA-binding domain-containing protein [Alphaproteobacteria bacterium]
MNAERGKLVSGGRLQIPSRVRRELGLKDGDSVVMTLAEGELRVRPLRDVVAAIQLRLRRHVPEGVSLSEELIADRRAEAADD